MFKKNRDLRRRSAVESHQGISREKSVTAVASALCFIGCLSPALATAQDYPSKPIRLVVPYAPGGGSDIGARLLGAKLAETLRQQVVVENKAGAGTNIGSEYVAKSPADGYTLLYASPSLTVNMSLYKKLNFDTVRDFAAVSVFTDSPNILVVIPSFPAKSVKDLVALGRAKPGMLSYSSAGNGSSQHLAGELFKLNTGLDIVHIPFKGTSPSLTSLVGGEVALSFANPAAISQYIKSGRLKGLASTGPKRSDQLPDVPTLRESGVNMDVTVWYGVLAPANTPAPIVQKLADSINKIAHQQDMVQRLRDLGAEPVGNTPEQFSKQLRDEVAMWAKVVKAAGMRAD
jgi:tripartite-type tricarboxylate transporter receptor subunit TctC